MIFSIQLYSAGSSYIFFFSEKGRLANRLGWQFGKFVPLEIIKMHFNDVPAIIFSS